MTPLRRLFLLKALKLFDLSVAAFAFLVALLAVDHRGDTGPFSGLPSIEVSIWESLLFLDFLLAWHIAFSLCGLYQSRRLSSRRDVVLDVARATYVGIMILILGGFLLRIEIITPVFVACFALTAMVVGVASRMALRYSLERVRLRGRNLRHLLLVGANPRTVDFARRLAGRPELGYRVLGFVDDDWQGVDALAADGFERVARLDDFSDYIRDHVVDEVVIGLPMRSSYWQAADVVDRCEEQGITVRFLSNLFGVRPARSRVDRFDEELVVTVVREPLDGGAIAVKRALDFCLSAALLAVLSPLLLVTALAVKLASPGPILFAQERVGLNKRKFRLYKFRTMVQDAEQRMAKLEHLNEISGPVFKIRNDPRLTPVGRLLRKTSIDELPQLINVIKGEMSLVGPRPLPVRDYERFEEDWHRRRFSVRPGITCLWQVHGRSSIAFDRWMQLDMQYIDEWSLLLDLKILCLTVPAVIRGSGAA